MAYRNGIFIGEKDLVKHRIKTNSKDVSFSKLWEIVKEWKPSVLQSMESQRVGHN